MTNLLDIVLVTFVISIRSLKKRLHPVPSLTLPPLLPLLRPPSLPLTPLVPHYYHNLGEREPYEPNSCLGGSAAKLIEYESDVLWFEQRLKPM